MRGYGMCWRCEGSGLVARDELRPAIRTTCPRCGGSGSQHLGRTFDPFDDES
jgi:DnaJ-class molecular chaperone